MSVKAVFIADVVGSSLLPAEARQSLDEDLRHLFKTSNKLFSNITTGLFDFTVGDEFQAVFGSADAAIQPILHVHSWLASQAKAPGVRIRTSTGIGLVFVDRSQVSREQDGPAFHLARKRINFIHKQRTSLSISCAGKSALVVACNRALDIGCRFIDATWSRWTAAQWEAAYWRWQGKNSAEVADILKVAPQNVSKRLKSARFSLVDETFRNFRELLCEPTLIAEMS